MNIKATAIGVIVGTLLGGPAAVQAYDKVQPKPQQQDFVGDGFYIDCFGNGAGGKRTCDIHVIERPGAPVHRMNVNVYSNQRFEVGVDSWGYNGGRDKDRQDPNGPTVDDFVSSRVVR